MRKWPAQVGTVVANVGRELSLLKMAINMINADNLSFFSMERTGAPLPTAGNGVPGVIYKANDHIPVIKFAPPLPVAYTPHYSDVTMRILASQITGDSTVCLSICSD